MTKPFFYLSRDQIDEFYDFIFQYEHNLDSVVSRLLLLLGFKSYLLGVGYLREAIKYVYGISSVDKISFSKSVYPYVADKFESTVDRVARDINTAITDCHNNGGLAKLNSVCGYVAVDQSYPPSNRAFIMAIVDWIRLNDRCCRQQVNEL